VKIIFKDPKKQAIKLIPENLDDIWHLYNIINEGDLIQALSYRTDEQQADKIRQKKPEKKRMKLGIRVDKVEFHEFSDRLRIHGIIEEGPQDLGSHHTLNIDADKLEPLTIVKTGWAHHHLDRIDEAVRQRNQPVVLFISLDEDTATIALLRQCGIQHMTDIESHRSGKMYASTSTDKEYFGEIFSTLKTYHTPDAPVVIVGPGFTREHLLNQGKNQQPALFKNTQSLATGNPGLNGIHEAIKTGVVDRIAKENRVSLETKYIEQLFEEIKKEGLATYGEQDVATALEKGAVERLLISDIVIRTPEGEQLLNLAKQTNSDFIIINSLHEIGKKFQEMGGIAALLGFKL